MCKYRHSVNENPKSGYKRLIGNRVVADRVLCVSTTNWECWRPCAQSGRQSKNASTESWDLMWNWHSLTDGDCTQNNLLWSSAQLCQTISSTAVVWNQSRCPSDSLQAAAVRGTVWLLIRFRDEKCLPSNHHSTRRTIGFMHQSVPRSDTLIPAATHALNIQQVGYGAHCRVNDGYDWTDILQLTLGWRWTASITVMCCCLSRCFQQSSVSQNDLYSQNNMLLTAKFVIFLCSVISQGKVVALDRWGEKWNHLSMMPRLTTDYAKNYCNRTLIVCPMQCIAWDRI